jgi:dethiobiotin synthetase
MYWAATLLLCDNGGMSIFVTGTGTDIGKTYVSAILVKRLRDEGVDVAYYKPVMSGGTGDCDYIREVTGAPVYNSYSFDPAVSPHLAARRAGEEILKEKIAQDFECIKEDYVVVEGAGGIFTPLGENLTQPDIIKMLDLPLIIVADAGLGTINATVLTVEYARAHDIEIKGIILNRYAENNPMHTDNKAQIEKWTGEEILECLG